MTDTPSGLNTLAGVSCGSTSLCVAVGEPGTVSLIWDGTSWSLQNTVKPSGPASLAICNGVSCAPAGGCTAVGTQGSASTPLVERYS